MLPQELRNTTAAQTTIGWIHLSKGQISKQQIERQIEHIGATATRKKNALDWATTVIDYFLNQRFKVGTREIWTIMGAITKNVPTS